MLNYIHGDAGVKLSRLEMTGKVADIATNNFVLRVLTFVILECRTITLQPDAA